MKILFLDDCLKRTKKFRSRVPSCKTTTTADDCIRLLEQSWDIVLLDHDLGGEVYCDPSREDTGSEVVRWIVANKPEVGQFVIHTLNHYVRGKMEQDLSAAGYTVSQIPFLDLEEIVDLCR